ncbi:MAG TPA: branched-chain amino acid ABC transporter substrate-binding protein, partial [Alcanivorax sp.]|nr:branched-chain amino acid ABC transporter substrate-binding protein [Alcanivorax sp.]HCJ64743.1 branched-chain amino acid ABC transporter substrate-binding protein [Alcanivorax sp.]
MGLKKSLGIVAACLLASAAHAATPVKLGLNYPHTGEYSEEGLMQKRGALMAIDEINAAGGVRGRPLELIERDSASQAERSRRNVDELAAEGAAMLFGGS